MMSEIWKNIPGFSRYKASSLGRIMSARKVLAQSRGTHGYLMVSLLDDAGRRCSHCVHSIVTSAFVGKRPDGFDCCHNDGNRDNNASVNLRWDTRQANIDDQKRHGSFGWHGRKKLSNEDIPAIVGRIRGGDKAGDIAKDYDVCRATIGAVSSGSNWGSESGLPKGRGGSREFARGHKLCGVLENDDVLNIVRRIDAGEKQKLLAEEYRVKCQTVSCIHRGLSWSWLTGRVRKASRSSSVIAVE